MRYIYSIIFVFVVLWADAQNASQKRVLVIPYGRFEFASEFTLEEIAEKNNILPSEVFNAYQKAILNKFSECADTNIQFIAINDIDYAPYKKYIKYKDGKFNGRNHYAINVKQFPDKEFATLLLQFNANFVVFINWYSIKKEIYVDQTKRRKRHKYSGHYIDYEIFNSLKQKIIGVGKQHVELKNPSIEELAYKSLRLVELEKGYQNFIITIIHQLNNPLKEKAKN